MTNPTSNFGWQMPTSTDLVTDLPADFEVFGQAVDTSLADLKGGTTGQVLKKNSNTDMDFVWGADSAGMTNPMTTTGDTIYSSSGSTPARLGIGSTGQVLTVSGGIPAWATTAAPVDTWTAVTSSALSGLSTITISSLNYSKLILWVDNQSSASTFSDIRVRFNNSSTAADYDQAFLLGNQGATSNNFTSYKGALTAFDVTDSGNGGFWLNLFNGKSTSTKQVSFVGGSTTDSSSGTFVGYGNFNGTSAITELTVFRGSGTWTGGTLYVYGA